MYQGRARCGPRRRAEGPRSESSAGAPALPVPVGGLELLRQGPGANTEAPKGPTRRCECKVNLSTKKTPLLLRPKIERRRNHRRRPPLRQQDDGRVPRRRRPALAAAQRLLRGPRRDRRLERLERAVRVAKAPADEPRRAGDAGVRAERQLDARPARAARLERVGHAEGRQRHAVRAHDAVLLLDVRPHARDLVPPVLRNKVSRVR